MPRIDIVVSDESASILCNDEELLIIAADEKGIHIAPIEATKVHLVDYEDLPSDDLDIGVRGVYRIGSLQQRSNGRTTPRYTPEATVAKSDDAQVRQVLDLIEKSWAEYPAQSLDFTQSETHRIAREVYGDDDHTSVMRVAGVRAARTRGYYT